MKKLMSIAGALFLSIALAGCQTNGAVTTAGEGGQVAATTTAAPSTTAAGTSTTPETAPGTTQASATTGAAAVEETSYPYTFQSASGEEVVIASQPQRIVSLSPTFTEIVFGLGVGDRLVGRTDYCDYPAETQGIPSVGTMIQPSVEAIIALEPDVVFVSFMEAEMLEKIELSGATVVQIDSSNSIEGSYATMTELGRILNVNEETKAVIDGIRAEIEAVAEKTKDLEPVSVYYVAGFGQGGDYTAGGDTFMNDLIEAAGATNAAGDAEGWSYSAEQLIAKDPDFIVIGSMADLTEEFKSTEPYSSLTAVKEDRVMEIDDNLISREGPRLAEGVRLMAEIFHPEAFE